MRVNWVDLTGKVFGLWTVVESDSNRKGRFYWHCICKCGVHQRLSSGDLNDGSSFGCRRCMGLRSRSPNCGGAKTRILHNYKNNAIKRGHEWNLDSVYAFALMKENCHYCGDEPRNVGKPNSESSADCFIYNGLDRVDNSKGYVVGNVVPCCRSCNRAKDTKTYSEFTSWVLRVCTHLNLTAKNSVVGA